MMASVGFFVCIFKLPFCSHTLKHSHTIRLPSLPTTLNSKFSLTSSQTITTFVPIHSPSFIYSPKPSIFTVFAAKGYKRKTHKASAKRFRVTGTGKIVRRRAGKQHLLSKKSSNRKRRLSKMVQCWLCKKFVNQGDEVLCFIDECRHAYHKSCAKLKKGSSKAFKCSKHKACYIYNRKSHWRCVRCFTAFHTKCSPWPNAVFFLANWPRWAICWRHSTNWRLDEQLRHQAWRR